ncbi:MAG: hypothetical protein JW759_07215 [Candidatus Coatesbacteria bacterium]|nr:hypothetical protein [Candidatus Coatesbacteria bacterium]
MKETLQRLPRRGCCGRRYSKRALASCVRLAAFTVLPALLLVMCAGAAESPIVKSTAKSREDVKLAIYDGRALVSEIRRIELPKGRCNLVFEDVPATIDPSSVQVLLADRKTALRVLEQNYKSAGITRDELTKKTVGEYVTLTDKDRRIKARLLAPDVYEIEGEVLIGYQGPVQLPRVPEGLVARPVLSCVVEAGSAGEHAIELSYLVSGVSWSGFYTSTLGEDEGSMSLRGLILIANSSGASFENARVCVVAGAVHNLQQDEPPRMEMRAMKMAGAYSSEDQIAPISEFEYHVYPLPEPVTVELNQDKQVGFLSSDRCQVSKRHRFEWSYHSGREEPKEEPAKVTLRVKNNEASGLGVPLPQGQVRVYKRLNNQLLFMGEDRIANVPKAEKFDLYVGSAFDVVGKKTRTKFRSLGQEGEESSFEVWVANRKLEDARVVVSETIPGDWEMLESTLDYERVTANKVEFSFMVAANEEKTVEYSIRINRRF